MEIKRSLLLWIALAVLLPSGSLLAGPRYYSGSDEHTSVGIRLGWVGAPNGFTYRRQFAPGQAFEVVAGYSPKFARRTELPAYRKGNTFLGISYAPNLTIYEGNLAVGIYLDLGMRLNFHHYRHMNVPAEGWIITPDAIAGAGMQIEFSESVEVFGDMHVKYFSNPGNYWAPGVESGAGIRFWLN